MSIYTNKKHDKLSSRKVKVLALSLGQGLTTAVHVTCEIVFVRILSLEDLATYRQTMLAYNFATPLLTLGIPSAIYYFLAGAKTRQRGIIFDHLTLLFFMGLIFSAFLGLGGTELLALRFNNPNLRHTLKLLILLPLFSFPQLPLNAVLIIFDKINLSAVLNTSLNLVLSVALIASCVITKSYTAPIVVKVIYSMVTLPIMLKIILSIVKEGNDWPSISNMPKILKLSIPLGLASMLGSITLQINKVIVSSICTPEQFAIYSNGAFELPLIGVITGSITTIVMTDMTKMCKEGMKNEALELFQTGAYKSALFLLPIMCFLLLNNHDFIVTLYSDKYAESVLPFTIYLFILPIRIVLYNSAYMALGKSNLLFVRSVFDLIINSLLCYTFVKLFDAWGAALAIVVTSYIWSVPYNLVTLSKEFQCSPLHIIPIKKISRILIFSLILAIISKVPVLYLSTNPIVRLGTSMVIFCLMYVVVGYYFVPDIRAEIQRFLTLLKTRLHVE